ncbi:MAG: SpoIID/LytB domain-containing protein [bacterium]|nr:SpoIID/LytB domain-containing protein [bacterium]
MRKLSLFLIFIIFFISLPGASGNKIRAADIKLKVAVFRGEQITLSSPAGLIISGPQENLNTLMKNLNIINFSFKDGKLFLEEKEIQGPVIIKSRSENKIKLGDDLYRGDMEIRPEEDNLLAINEVPLEEYLFSVVGGEIYPSWPEEVLKAQAVAARTYALFQYGKNKDKTYQLESSVDSQRYIGIAGENKNITKAVLETEGLVMTYHNGLIQAFFHSTCGGKTEDVSSLWPGNNLPYLESKICSFCRDAENYNWQFSITRSDLEKILLTDENFKGKLNSFKVTALTRTGRVSELTFRTSEGDKKMNVSDFRRWIGQDKIKSTFFKIDIKKDTFIFTGHGSGHGVGLCQEGAKTLALKKNRYDKILKFYYPGVKIEKYL